MKAIPLITAAELAMGGQLVEVEASLAWTVTKADVKRGVPARTATTLMVGKHTAASAVAGNVSDVPVVGSRYPESVAHIDDAPRIGQPKVLTLDRDEYPPAVTTLGGFNASIRVIGAGEGRAARKAMERRVNELRARSRICPLLAR